MHDGPPAMPVWLPAFSGCVQNLAFFSAYMQLYMSAISMISIVAAMSRNRIIGAGGGLPWDVPADMRRFRELTLGHTVVMGRRTFEGIGGPLPGRKNIVVTRQPDYCCEGAFSAGSLDEALQLARNDGEVFICGGAEIYALALLFAARIYLTIIECEMAGDAEFPLIPENSFAEISRERLSDDPPAVFVILERGTPSEEVSAE